MDDRPDGEKGPLTPTPRDLERIARSLNGLGCRYAVIGGFAMLHYGFARPTQDINLLIDPTPANVDRVRTALSILADHASLEVAPDDLQTYSVVRIADEIVIDLLGSACGITFGDIETRLEYERVGGTEIPFAGPRDLFQTKASIRPKDAMDRDFLARLLSEES